MAMIPVLSIFLFLLILSSMSDSEIASFSVFYVCVSGWDCPFNTKTRVICKMLYNELNGRTMVYTYGCASLTLY